MSSNKTGFLSLLLKDENVSPTFRLAVIKQDDSDTWWDGVPYPTPEDLEDTEEGEQ